MNISLQAVLRTISVQKRQFSRRSLSFVRTHGCEIWLISAVAIYTLVFSYITIIRYLSLHASAYDLGIYNQALFTAVRSGKFFFYTADLPANPAGSIFGTHFLPVLFLLLPVYWVFPRVETLLVAQSFVLALSAVPLYLLGRRLRSKRTALLFSVLYLSSPLIQSPNWADFHPEAFIPLGLLTAIYAMHSKRWGFYFAGVLLALSSLEFASVITGLYSLIKIVEHRRSLLSSIRAKSLLQPGPVSLITFGISLLWFFFSTATIRTFNPGNAYFAGGLSTWSILGASSILTVPLKLLLDPYHALMALSYDILLKLFFIAQIFGPFIIFLRKSRRFILMTLPWTLIALPSNFTPYYTIYNQYLVFYAPFVFAGALYGLRRLVELGLTRRRLVSRFYPAMIIGCCFVALLLAVPIAMTLTVNPVGIPSVSQHEKLVSEVVSMIPSDASVLTQPNLFPLVSGRSSAYLFPYQTYYPPGTTFNSTLQSFMNQSQFILLDTKSGGTSDIASTTWIINTLRATPTHGLYVSADGVLLYKRGYVSQLFYFSPINQTLTAGSLTLLSGNIVRDSLSYDGYALHSTADNKTVGPFWTGPGQILPLGGYRVDFRIKVANNYPGELLKLGVVSARAGVNVTKTGDSKTGYNLQFSLLRGPAILNASTSVYRSNFAAINSYQDFTMNFTLSENAYVDFTGALLAAQSNVYLERITLTQVSTV